MLKIADLFDLTHTRAAALFDGKTYPWEVLADIGDYIKALGATLPESEFDHPAEDVWIAKDATTAQRCASAHSSAATRSSVRTPSWAIPAS